MGFDKGFMNAFRSAYLMPIAHLLYPEWVKEGLDSHKAFIVKYAIGDDVELSYHFDNAEVTLNVCLGRTFHGGALYFGPMRGVSGGWSEGESNIRFALYVMAIIHYLLEV